MLTTDQEIRAHIQAKYDEIQARDGYRSPWALGSALSGYDAIIGLCVDEVVADEQFGDYQGDAYVVVRRGQEYGFLTYSYGSCSGCDWYEASESVDDFVEMACSLRDDTHWEPDADALLRWLGQRDWPTQASYYYAEEKPARDAIYRALHDRVTTQATA